MDNRKTIKQYCEKTGKKIPTVTRAIRERRKLDFVDRIETYNRFYVLIVSKDFPK